MPTAFASPQTSSPRGGSSEGREAWADSLLGSMSLAQKIGQLMVFSHYGPFITPDVRRMIREHHVGGFRISQKFHPGSAEHRRALRPISFGNDEQNQVGEKLPPPAEFLERSSYGPDWSCYDRGDLPAISCGAEEFAATLNELRTLSAEAGNSAGLHYAFDHEGEWGDFCFGTARHFPNPLGLYATGDPSLAYEVGRAIGLQARALGANFIHSPVLDIASNPLNPEVGTRSFGPNAAEVCRFGMQSFLGLTSAGLITAAKHFPGRGDSVSDAHYKLPVVTASAEVMHREHLRPYRELIEAGLPAIMAAFSAYPSLEKDSNTRRPAATSKQIITGLLREEMGFDGVITTDNCQMGGLLEIHEIGEAAVRSLQAGCDLILFRAYTPARDRVIAAVRQAVESGEYPLADLDASVRRILRMRHDMGLANDHGCVSVEQAAAVSRDPEIIQIEQKAAEKSITVLRDEGRLLPLTARGKILLVEQAHSLHLFQNNTQCHPGVLWKEMCRLSDQVGTVLVRETPTEEDRNAVQKRLDEADIIVATNYYNYRGQAPAEDLLRTLHATGKPVVTVTNNPFATFGAPPWAPTVIVNFGISSAAATRAVAEIIFGKLKPSGHLSINLGTGDNPPA